MIFTAEDLEGQVLEDGWEVIEKIKSKPEETGGHFSTGYKIKKGNQLAFLKAIDFSDAEQMSDPLLASKNILEAYLFERDLLKKCNKIKLSKIVTAIGDGHFAPNNAGYYYEYIYYIIFEYAEGNIRRQINSMKYFDLAWILRSLHNTAVGLYQLHKNGIAHQDLKPSNVLVFKDASKICDLGRSHDIEIRANHDNLIKAGDMSYYPFDTDYSNKNSFDFSTKVATDLYLLGSLIFYYFLKVNLKQLLIKELTNQNSFQNLNKKDFYADLPYYQKAFNSVLAELEKEINNKSKKICKELIPLVKMLCNLDPSQRGHKVNVLTGNDQYSLERFISKFDLIAKYAEYKIYE